MENRRTCIVLGIALTRLKAEEANLVRANILVCNEEGSYE
jgi:hypothetical protein